ncbi:MAG: ribosome maturation factor RimP [Desulfovibrio sp.]|jgi:ribosome maturation factor RimP|nr:ribosome maturation factor RimP [Desulfovibrio sp.]
MAHEILTKAVAALAAPLARGMGLALWGVELMHAGRFGVRVFVENAGRDGPRAGESLVASGNLGPDNACAGDAGAGNAGAYDPVRGADVEQCAEFSRLLGLALDAEDIMPGPYVLEVSSPGMDRAFFDADRLEQAAGCCVEVTLRAPAPAFPGRKRFRGVLLGREGADFVLSLRDEHNPDADAAVRFAFADAAKVRLVPLFPDKKPPGRGGKKKA